MATNQGVVGSNPASRAKQASEKIAGTVFRAVPDILKIFVFPSKFLLQYGALLIVVGDLKRSEYADIVACGWCVIRIEGSFEK